MEQGEQSIERSNTRLNRSRSKRLQGQKIFSTLFRPKGANYLTLHFHHAKIPFCLIVCKWNEWIIGKTADFILVFLQAVNKRTNFPFLRSSTLLFFFFLVLDSSELPFPELHHNSSSGNPYSGDMIQFPDADDKIRKHDTFSEVYHKFLSPMSAPDDSQSLCSSVKYADFRA